MERDRGAQVTDDREVAWRGYRIRTVAFWSAAIGWLPASAGAFSLFGVRGPTIAFSLMWFAGISAVGVWQASWSCPRCRHSFLGEGNWGYSRTCATCGLKVGQER